MMLDAERNAVTMSRMYAIAVGWLRTVMTQVLVECSDSDSLFLRQTPAELLMSTIGWQMLGHVQTPKQRITDHSLPVLQLMPVSYCAPSSSLTQY